MILIQWLSDVYGWLLGVSRALGYGGIVGLMALESSFFPFPSELVVPPGGANSSGPDATMNLLLVILAGTLGSVLGALFNYWLAVKLGRPLCLKYGRYFFLSEPKFRKVEAFFLRHGEIGTFIGRLIPGIRQYVSFPAGLARMPIWRFCLFTALGAGIWVTVLALIGYTVGTDIAEDPLLMKKYAMNAMIYGVPALVLITVAYVWWNKKKRKATDEPAADAAPEAPTGEAGGE